MKQLAGMRKADRRLGDDTTFTRFVFVEGARGKVHSPRLPGLELDFVREGRTKFRKAVQAPNDNLLVSGHSNIKIGRDVRVGRFKGWWLYTLSLEERKTCPSSCHHWQSCYGNNMPFAKRVDHTHPDFLPKLEAQLDQLCNPKRSGRGKRALRQGVIVRLHALGDFYSPEYVGFWSRMLYRHPRLMVFGYTAWAKDTPIGAAVNELIDTHWGRAMIRFSNGGYADRSTVSIVNEEDCPPGAFVCPEQTGQFEACGKCGACWSTLKNVAFLAH